MSSPAAFCIAHETCVHTSVGENTLECKFPLAACMRIPTSSEASSSSEATCRMISPVLSILHTSACSWCMNRIYASPPCSYDVRCLTSAKSRSRNEGLCCRRLRARMSGWLAEQLCNCRTATQPDMASSPSLKIHIIILSTHIPRPRYRNPRTLLHKGPLKGPSLRRTSGGGGSPGSGTEATSARLRGFVVVGFPSKGFCRLCTQHVICRRHSHSILQYVGQLENTISHHRDIPCRRTAYSQGIHKLDILSHHREVSEEPSRFGDHREQLAFNKWCRIIGWGILAKQKLHLTPLSSEAMTLLRLPRRSRGWDTADTSVPPCRGAY